MTRKLPHARRALTLIELIVVLLILVGLAGILIPMLPNMLGRTHTAAGATNMQEIVKWVQTYEQLHFTHPDQWDALTDGTNLVTYLPKDGAGVPVGGKITAAPLTAGEVAALDAIGVRNVHLFAAAPTSPTFDPYATPLPSTGTPITDSVSLAILNPESAAEKIGLSPLAKYVVLGLGKRCTIIGKTVAEAPVAFADEPAINAADFYSRFLVIYKVSNNTGTLAAPVYEPLSRAILVGSISLHPDDVDGTGQHLEEFYGIVKDTK